MNLLFIFFARYIGKTSLLLFLLTGLMARAYAIDEKDWLERNKLVVNQHILIGYNNLFEGSVLYRTFIEELCIAQGPMELEVARSAFQQLVQLWQRVQHLRIGPVETDNRFYRIQMFPDKRDSVGKHVNKLLVEQNVDLLVPENLEKTSVAAQGLPMMERILFKDEKIDDFQCGLLLVAAINLQKQITILKEGWEGTDIIDGYAESMLATDLESDSAEYARHSQVSSKLLNVLVAAVQSIKENKLERAMTDNLNNPKPKRLEFWRSGQSLESILSNMKALKEFYGYAFGPLVNRLRPETHTDIDRQFDEIIYQLNSIPDNLDAILVSDERNQVATLRDKINQLLQTITMELPRNLGLQLGFNSLDGD